MPTLAERAAVERPVHTRPDGRKCRLKVREDLSLRQMISIMEGNPAYNPDFVSIMFYDQPVEMVNREEGIAAWEMFTQAMAEARKNAEEEENKDTPPMDLGETLPVLQFEFGSPGEGDWIDVPIWRVDLYMKCLPVLRARQSLRWSRIVSFGNGLYKRGQALSIQSEWLRASRQDGHRGSTRIRSPEELKMVAAMHGITVKMFPVPEAVS